MSTRGRKLLSCIRFGEVLVLQGPPLTAAVLAGVPASLSGLLNASVLALANGCLVAHMWLLNDWSDRDADAGDPRKAPSAFSGKGVGPAPLLGLSLGLLAVGLPLFAWLGLLPFGFALAVAGVSLLYSVPGIAAKRIPLLSSLLHLAGGALHFLLGYSVFGGLTPEALRMAPVFAVTFAAGHGVQEIQDFEGDLRNGTRTHAVLFGKRRVFRLTLAAFLGVYAYVAFLAFTGLFPAAAAPAAGLLLPAHLFFAQQAQRDGLGFDAVRRYRARYRRLFAGLGLLLLASALWK